jgi:hypothetical protein
VNQPLGQRGASDQFAERDGRVGVRNHDLGVDLLSVGKTHARHRAALHEDFDHLGAGAKLGTVALGVICERFLERTSAREDAPRVCAIRPGPSGGVGGAAPSPGRPRPRRALGSAGYEGRQARACQHHGGHVSSAAMPATCAVPDLRACIGSRSPTSSKSL